LATGTTEPGPGPPSWRSLVSHSPKETWAVGRSIGARLQAGDCIALTGGLGTGKTTLTQGIVAGAGGDDNVRSPTFLLHTVHPGRITVHHLDLYRLAEGSDLGGLGLEELLEDGAAVVEWAERTSPEWFNAQIRIEALAGSSRALELRLPDRLRPFPEHG
jgi:tRNA threonylcarbamoyl adenosine modification protein YjeE